MIQEVGHFQYIMSGNGRYSMQFNTQSDDNYMFVIGAVEFAKLFPAGTPNSHDQYYIEIQTLAPGKYELHQVTQDTADDVIFGDEMPEIADYVSEYEGDQDMIDLKQAQQRVTDFVRGIEEDTELVDAVQEARAQTMETSEDMIAASIQAASGSVDTKPAPEKPALTSAPKSFDSLNLDISDDDEDDDGDY